MTCLLDFCNGQSTLLYDSLAPNLFSLPLYPPLPTLSPTYRLSFPLLIPLLLANLALVLL
jgi:hypothetical protein